MERRQVCKQKGRVEENSKDLKVRSEKEVWVCSMGSESQERWLGWRDESIKKEKRDTAALTYPDPALPSSEVFPR